MASRKGAVQTKEVRVESQLDGYHQQLLAEGRGQIILTVGPTVGRHEAPADPDAPTESETVAEIAAEVAEEASDDDSVAAQ